MNEREALKLALQAHSKNERHHTLAETRYWCEQYKLLAKQAIKALEQPKQEPVAWLNRDSVDGLWHVSAFKTDNLEPSIPLYKHPAPQRKPLTFEQVEDCFPENAIFAEADGWLRVSAQTLHNFARNVQAAHGIKGEA